MSLKKFYRIECALWVEDALKQNRFNGAVVILIRPLNHNARFIGAIKLPSGETCISSGWCEHYALLLNGVMYDEAYPNGIPRKKFENRFLQFRELYFEQRPTTTWYEGNLDALRES